MKADGHLLPDLNSHIPVEFQTDGSAMLREAVDVLLRVGTCFAVIGGEARVRTTERGAEALRDALGDGAA